MPVRTYFRGLVFWIDDDLAGKELPKDVWSALFGHHSDRVFRLMDLKLEIATSYEEALARIASFDTYCEAGTFIFCIVDLLIPARAGTEPAMKYGIALAKELRSRNLTFTFLSSNTGGTSTLDQEHLNTVPYHVKEPGGGWRFPKSLILNLLGELRRRISWVSVEDAVRAMDETSAIRSTYRQLPESFRYFPYFGPFREFVERCEYKEYVEFGRVMAVRSRRKHCDEFVQQAISILLFQLLIRKPGAHIVHYGHAHDASYLDVIARAESSSDINAIAVIRISPDHTTVEQLEGIIESIGLRAGRTIFVLPNDESVDPFVEFLREHNILASEELPQTRFGDPAQREELVRYCCVLAFHQWIATDITGVPLRLERGSLEHPELLLNPIHWTVLLEAIAVPEALSDPFEIVKEFNRVLRSMSKRQRESIEAALREGHPIPYKNLLTVGHETLMSSEFAGKYVDWIERTLDLWLRTAWNFPYGITDGVDHEVIGANDEDGTWTQDIDYWQDSCFEILVGILDEYQQGFPCGGKLGARQENLFRVMRFVETLGKKEFLSTKLDSVNWDELALMRWPHRQYPMPSAVLRRLRDAGRYLWIQPEGLDIATALPAGRQRYRLLGSIVDQYWSVVTWARATAPKLPLGWRESVTFLTEIIAEHQIASAWQNEPNKVWYAFLTLLRNGAPILYIASRLIQGKFAEGAEGSAKEYLLSVTGYGKILDPVRGSREQLIGGCLVPFFSYATLIEDLARLQDIGRILSLLEDHAGGDSGALVRELQIAARELISVIEGLPAAIGEPGSEKDVMTMNRAFADFFSDPAINMTGGWYPDELVKRRRSIKGEFFKQGDILSLLGTKADYLWQTLDALLCLENVTRAFRYYDGYHFLAALNELRVSYKDNMAPNVPLSVIETVLDLFVASIQGLVAQLALCLEMVGAEELANRICPPGVHIQLPQDFLSPSKEELDAVIKIKEAEESWEVFTLGIPGSSTVNKFCYQNGGALKEWVDL